jgi:hypothetical protein
MKHVTVERSKSRLGGALLHGSLADMEPWRAYVFLASGPHAERRFRGTTRARLSSGDRDLVDTLIEVTPLSAARVTQLEQLAEALIVAHEPWIHRVVDHLLRTRRLSAADVADLRDDDIDDVGNTDDTDETGAADDAQD